MPKNRQRKISLCFPLSGLILLFCVGVRVGNAEEDALLAIPQVSPAEQICFVLYTSHEGVLKLTAQLYPLADGAPREVRLETRTDGGWKEVAREKIISPGWTATFRVPEWDSRKDIPYRVRHGEQAIYDVLFKSMKCIRVLLRS